MKKEIIVLFAAILLCFCGCGNAAENTDSNLPKRMVSQIDVSVEPENPDMVRTYTDQEQLSPIMRMLRDLNNDDAPEAAPYQSGDHEYYNITVTYANGSTNSYTLLDNRYLRIGNDPWCEIDAEKSRELTTFLKDNP